MTSITDPKMQMYGHCHHRAISWSAIITGALVGIGLGFLLNLFGVSIGLSAFTTSSEGLTTLAVGGFIGMLIGVIASMFVSGFVAGYLGQPYCASKNLGVLYGFTAWCLSLVLAVMLASSFGHFISNSANAIANTSTTNVNMNMQQTAPMIKTEHKPSGNADVTVNPEKAANAIGVTTFATFILFFVGALSSCFGGHVGVDCRRKCSNDSCKM